MPEVSRTRATLRSAEFGFFGVVVYTRVQTPRRWGEPFSAGVFDFSRLVSRLLRTSCWIVGTGLPSRASARGGSNSDGTTWDREAGRFQAVPRLADPTHTRRAANRPGDPVGSLLGA